MHMRAVVNLEIVKTKMVMMTTMLVKELMKHRKSF